MSIGPFIAAWLVIEQSHEMMEESSRRMQELERRRREEEEHEKRRKEEENKMIEHRKNSPVVYNDSKWQINRCVKAFSMQPCVNQLVSIIEKVRPNIITDLEAECDKLLLDTDYEYELLKNELDKIIETLENSGITIKGKHYVLTRLPDSKVATLEKVTESFGDIFTIGNGKSINLNPKILSSDKYYEKRFQKTNYEAIKSELMDVNSKLDKYKKYGKHLGFLLKTKKYIDLKSQLKELKTQYHKGELRKKELESYNSINKDQLLVIKSYFTNLDKLTEISNKIIKLFDEKKQLREENNSYIYDLTIKEILSNNEYDELILEVSDYINKMVTNDEETMEEAYQLVKGEYPINIERRFLYDLMIQNLRSNPKTNEKQLRINNNI